MVSIQSEEREKYQEFGVCDHARQVVSVATVLMFNTVSSHIWRRGKERNKGKEAYFVNINSMCPLSMSAAVIATLMRINWKGAQEVFVVKRKSGVSPSKST